MKIPEAESITHQHIGAVIYSFLNRQHHTGVLHILDIGCGNGHLMRYIQSTLPALSIYQPFELYGMDVSDAGQQEVGYFEQTVNMLNDLHPEISWQDRLKLITTSDQLPYEDNFFDFIVSNQVMEHVMDYQFLFREIRRCLNSGGISINLFPVREIFWEGHAHMPFIHWIRDIGRRERLMLFFAKIGFKKRYHLEMERRGWQSINEFAHIYSRVIENDTNYLAAAQLVRTARDVEFNISFAYTKDFYIAKLLSFVGIHYYRYVYTGIFESVCFFLCKWFSSVTVILSKND